MIIASGSTAHLDGPNHHPQDDHLNDPHHGPTTHVALASNNFDSIDFTLDDVDLSMDVDDVEFMENEPPPQQKTTPVMENKTKSRITKKFSQIDLFGSKTKDPFKVTKVKSFRKNHGRVVNDHKRYKLRINKPSQKQLKDFPAAKPKSSNKNGMMPSQEVDHLSNQLIQSLLIQDKLDLVRGKL